MKICQMDLDFIGLKWKAAWDGRRDTLKLLTKMRQQSHLDRKYIMKMSYL